MSSSICCVLLEQTGVLGKPRLQSAVTLMALRGILGRVYFPYGSTTQGRMSQVLTAWTVTMPCLTFIWLWLSICSHSDRPVHLCTVTLPNVKRIWLFYALILWPPKDEIMVGCHISNSHQPLVDFGHMASEWWKKNVSNLNILGLMAVTEIIFP